MGLILNTSSVCTRFAVVLNPQLRIVSLELWWRVALSLESTVGHIGIVVVHEWHNWLRHSTIPLNIAWSSENISPWSLVVLVENWLLASSPFAVSIWHWWVLWKDASKSPFTQVWVVHQSFSVEIVAKEYNWTVSFKTTANTSNNEPHAVAISNYTSSIEILDWELTDNQKTKSTTDLSASSVAGPVKVRLIDWSWCLLLTWVPRHHNCQFTLSSWSEGWESLLKNMLGNTKADHFVVCDVLSGLWVHLSLVKIIPSILKRLVSENLELNTCSSWVCYQGAG